MTDINYPDFLPNFLISGYEFRDADNILRSDLEGPAETAKQYSQVSSQIPVSSKMSLNQFAMFDAWYEYKLNSGVNWFNIQLFVSNGTQPHVARFVGKPKPKTHGSKFWIVSAVLEVEERKKMSEAELDFLLAGGEP